MATKKQSQKKKVQPRNLSAEEYDNFFSHIGKARVMAYKIQANPKYTAEVRRAFRSIEKKLYNIGNQYFWGRMTSYERP